jgi:hypothetical protein
MRRAAVEGVAAYLADKDADVYNITDAAVREDAVAADGLLPSSCGPVSRPPERRRSWIGRVRKGMRRPSTSRNTNGRCVRLDIAFTVLTGAPAGDPSPSHSARVRNRRCRIRSSGHRPCPAEYRARRGSSRPADRPCDCGPPQARRVDAARVARDPPCRSRTSPAGGAARGAASWRFAGDPGPTVKIRCTHITIVS